MTRLQLVALLVGFAATTEAGVTFEKTNGIYTAKPGVVCTTRDSFATIFMNDLDRARNMITSSDNEAIKKFIAEKRMIYTKAGVVVIVERRFDNNIEVGPKGETVSLWMPAHGVECEVEKKEGIKAKEKKQR
jgi:hypothetical protein